ncbi:hypothetical protein A2304_03060 [Candidatus Uhrbacteria bacterium RIFOXYB2_FULL_57_15]|uniref:Aminoglycoside phosphotransferase domain-containing protein n=1 Tax=Candidatus Uhrbacteria bacterium RIFOXYB2_FULL_57_15 TaxID=1802422 RepID=A0A1F7W7P3_9BACT|nr:MAG: hypothetical protein A2304_03060 [Candidatus Uhrbacteria bacterium RIFOXYB2_FULL_57_15]OGM00005.1 MAG: hypothetical protein A2501_02705 [Candidatus Uhrbacteria bacterium RIFOXYC12_FULL_57_11]
MPYEISLDGARAAAGLALARAERLSGTGASATVRITGILKFAPDRSEVELLRWLEERLGSDYAACLPRFRDIGEVEGSFAIELEYVGDATLETTLASRERRDAIDPTVVVDRVAEMIARFATVSVPSDACSASANPMVDEVVGALSCNAMAAGSLFRPDPGTCRDHAVFVPGICHRDLSAVNVMCASDGSVRLIDPRASVPGAPVGMPTFGSSAIDAAAFLVSLERKELERDRLDLPRLGLTARFRDIVDGWIEAGTFNAFMLDLCLAHAYSVYAACRCDYCLAPEREWLYDLMRKRLESVSTRIA